MICRGGGAITVKTWYHYVCGGSICCPLISKNILGLICVQTRSMKSWFVLEYLCAEGGWEGGREGGGHGCFTSVTAIFLCGDTS